VAEVELSPVQLRPLLGLSRLHSITGKRSSALFDIGHTLWSLATRSVPSFSAPPPPGRRLHSVLSKTPFRVSHLPSAIRPLGRITFPGFPYPSTASSSKPQMERNVTSPRLRSQVFSTSQRLLSKLEFHSSISNRNRSWASPLQSFPLAEIASSSRSQPASLHFSPSFTRREAQILFILSFKELPRFWHACPPPLLTMDSLSSVQHRFPLVLVPTLRSRSLRWLWVLRSFPPPASPFTTTRVTPAIDGRDSLELFPFRDASRTSEPQPLSFEETVVTSE